MDAPPQTLRVCFVGDSYVAGTGDATCVGWVGHVCKAAWSRGEQISFYNLGVRGDTTEMVAARWRSECEARLPSEVPGRLVFSFGINDISMRVGQGLRVEHKRSVEVARSMLEPAARWQPTIWIGPTPANEAMSPMSPMPGVFYDFRNDRLLGLNQAYATVARDIGVPYLDLATPLTGNPAYQKSLVEGDRMHCDAMGYKLIAHLVDAWGPWRKLLSQQA
jgi:lysophospholipase L1-like esterase